MKGWTAEDEAENQALEAARDPLLDPDEQEHPLHCGCPECRADRLDP